MIWNAVCQFLDSILNIVSVSSDKCAEFWFVIFRFVWYVVQLTWRGLKVFCHDLSWFLELTRHRIVNFYYLLCDFYSSIVICGGNVYYFVSDSLMLVVGWSTTNSQLFLLNLTKIQAAVVAGVHSSMQSVALMLQQGLTLLGTIWYNLLVGIPVGIYQLLFLSASGLWYMFVHIWMLVCASYLSLQEFVAGIPNNALIGLGGMFLIVTGLLRWYSFALLKMHSLLLMKYLIHFGILCLARGLSMLKFFYTVTWTIVKVVLWPVYLMHTMNLLLVIRRLNLARRYVLNASPFHACDCEGVLEPSMCIICYEEKRTVVFMPCGHMCACETCFTRLGNEMLRCPVCRKNVVNSIWTIQN